MLKTDLFTQNILPVLVKKVQVGKDQEKAQSEKDSHSKNRGGEKTKLTIRYLYHETYRKPNEQLFSQYPFIHHPANAFQATPLPCLHK